MVLCGATRARDFHFRGRVADSLDAFLFPPSSSYDRRTLSHMLRHKSTSRASSHVTEDAEEGITERVEDPSDSEVTQPRKKVRWDGNVDTPDEEETEESSTTDVVEKVSHHLYQNFTAGSAVS